MQNDNFKSGLFKHEFCQLMIVFPQFNFHFFKLKAKAVGLGNNSSLI